MAIKFIPTLNKNDIVKNKIIKIIKQHNNIPDGERICVVGDKEIILLNKKNNLITVTDYEIGNIIEVK